MVTSSDEITSSQEKSLAPSVQKLLAKHRKRTMEQTRAEIAEEYEIKIQRLTESIKRPATADVAVEPNLPPSNIVVDDVEHNLPPSNIVVDDFQPVLKQPMDGVYTVEVLEHVHPLLKESKLFFQDENNKIRKDSSKDVGRKAVALLLGRPESDYTKIGPNQYEEACRLPTSQWRNVQPTGKSGGIHHFGLYLSGCEARRCVRVFRAGRNGRPTPHERVCSMCFTFGGRIGVYNNRCLCPSCGDKKMYYYQLYKCNAEEEEDEKIHLVSGKFKITLPKLKSEVKRKAEIKSSQALYKVAPGESDNYKIISQFCNPNKEIVFRLGASEKICCMFRALFDSSEKKTIPLYTRVQIPKGNMEELVEILRKNNIKITARKVEEKVEKLPPFVRKWRKGDVIGIIYLKHNGKIIYIGKLDSQTGVKHSDGTSADFEYEELTGTQLIQVKLWTCDEEFAARMEAISITAWTIGYFLQLENPYAEFSPVNLLNKELPFGELDLQEDGQYILDLMETIFNVKVEFEF